MYPSFEVYITLILMPTLPCFSDQNWHKHQFQTVCKYKKIIKMRLTELKKSGNYKQYYKQE